MSDLSPKVPLRVRVYEASRHSFEATVVRARTVLVGIWLGLLDRRALHAIDERYYGGMSKYHDEAYNLSGLFDWEANALDNHFHGCRAVLVTSAGGGREVVALRRRGLDVFAFECHPDLLEVGNRLLSQEGLSTRIELASRDECPSDVPTCDGAIVGWASYMMIQPRGLRIRFLQGLRTHLPAGAPLLLSFFARENDAPYLKLIATLANALRRVQGREKVEVGDDLVPNFVHHFSEAEIVAELQAGGFRMVEFSKAGYPHAIARATDASAADSAAMTA